jgi:hypothetical protein
MFVCSKHIGKQLVRLLLVPALLVQTLAAIGAAQEVNPAALRAALKQAHSWLQKNAPDATREKIGSITLDAWAWNRFATLHPDEAIRTEAEEQVRKRLLGLPPPGEPTPVHLTYWAVLLRLMDFHAVERLDYQHAAAAVDRDMALRKFKPTTVWWTERLLAFSGMDTEPDFSSTFIAQQSAAPESSFSPTLANAYQVFHELVPATDLGRHPLQLTREQRMFVRRTVPELLRMARDAGDTDAVAEVLVSAALVDARDTPAYHRHLAWLLSRQRADGAFESKRDAGKTEAASHYRHVMIVATWALMTAMPSEGTPP